MNRNTVYLLQTPAVAVSAASTVSAVKVDGLQTVSVGSYTYTITPEDLKMEQQAFEASEGVSPFKLNKFAAIVVSSFIFIYTAAVILVEARACQGFWGVYQVCGPGASVSKDTPTGLMRALISIWYSKRRLAAYSATSGINANIRTAVFSECNTLKCRDFHAWLIILVRTLWPFPTPQFLIACRT